MSASLSRRELLTALLGTPAALAACRRAPPTLAFEGDLLGQDVELGHRFRDRRWSVGDGDGREVRQVGAVIVGAGASGLSTAWKWVRSGFEDFAVVELEARPGGTSAWGQNQVSAFPWGAHYVPAPLSGERALTELLAEMGVLESAGDDAHAVREEHLCRAPQERLFFAGQWREGLYPRYGAESEDLRQLRAFEEEMDRWVGLGPRSNRPFIIPSALGQPTPESDGLDRISMADWMSSKRWSSPRLRWYVDYACRDDYGLSSEQTSAWAGIFYFTSRVASAGKPAADLVTFPEGNGRLIHHLASVAQAQLEPQVVATAVRQVPQGAEVDAWDHRRQRAVRYQAKHAVVAAPQFVARRLVEGLTAARPDPGLSRGSWVVANLTLRGRPEERGFPLAWDNVIHGSKSLGYVVATHQTGVDHGPTVLTWYLPLIGLTPADERQHLLGCTWREWADAVISDLSVAHPDLSTLVERLDVWRWGHAMVRPVVGSLRSPSLVQAREPLGNIHFANTDLSGMALFEEAQYWGLRAAEAVLRDRGAAFTSSLGER